MSQLDELKKYTTVVADTGDIESIKSLHPGCDHQPLAGAGRPRSCRSISR